MRRYAASLAAALILALTTTTTAAAPARAAYRAPAMTVAQVTVAADAETALEAAREAARQVLAGYGYTVINDYYLDRALRHWQTANGLAPDGIVGPDTAASLGIGAQPDPAFTPPPDQPVAADVMTPEQIIRDVWPDELENWAVKIAYRESRLTPGVRNSCCFGLFQIYWTVHRGWLADMGITSADQLFDARTNAEAALALYYRAEQAYGNGRQPWGGR